MEIKFYRAKGKGSSYFCDKPKLGKVCILNFADYVRPGGTFNTDDVEWTQEECLCRDIPGLYDELCSSKNAGFYEKGWLRQDEDQYIYTEFADRSYDVISACAPLHGSYESRVKMILDAMEEHHIDWPVIGWWGCGVYGRRKKDCLRAFKKIVRNGNYHFKGIIWPDPYGT